MLRVAVTLSLASYIGCSKPAKPGTETQESTEIDPGIGEQVFQMRCFVCHGRSGKGDGPSAQGLGARVRDLTEPNWQNSMSDKSIAQVIRSGAKAVGGSAAMPPNPDLSDVQVQSLTKYIRGLREK